MSESVESSLLEQTSLNNDKKKQRFFWKGRRVSEHVFKERVEQSKRAKERKKYNGLFVKSPNLQCDDRKIEKTKEGNFVVSISTSESFMDIEGRRIVHIKTLGEQLFCKHCKFILSLTDITEERRHGLASTFYVACRQCNKISSVNTDKQHDVMNKRRHWDINAKAALGTINAGLGITHLNKVLSTFNIPVLSSKSYKTHEVEVGRALENFAEECCLDAAMEERCLTIENSEKMKILLPDHLKLDFIFPDSSEEDIKNHNIPDSKIVRIAGSLDMGWFTRGTGRTYDSLSGTATFIGFFTGKIICYVVLSRKCKMCDLEMFCTL